MRIWEVRHSRLTEASPLRGLSCLYPDAGTARQGLVGSVDHSRRPSDVDRVCAGVLSTALHGQRRLTLAGLVIAQDYVFVQMNPSQRHLELLQPNQSRSVIRRPLFYCFCVATCGLFPDL